MPDEKLSEGAQRLLELCGTDRDENKASVAETLKEHPELLPALDEYIKHREDHCKAVECRIVTPRMRHGLAKKVNKTKK